MAKQATKLDRLNALLKEHATELELPAFRSSVGTSGSNLDWLRSRLARRSDIPAELTALLNTEWKVLLGPAE